MTDEQVAALGPAFTEYLGCFRSCFLTKNTFAHLGTYCRGLISDLARKSVEPMALAAGAAVRTLQEFLTHHRWDHDGLLARLQRRIVERHLPPPGQPPADGVGTVGLIDETSVAKKGDKTPGVQRQYCGALGKVEHCTMSPLHLLPCRSRICSSSLRIRQSRSFCTAMPANLAVAAKTRAGENQRGGKQFHPLPPLRPPHLFGLRLL
jgi:SRSO17 transposase